MLDIEQLSGIMPALVSPLEQDGTVDQAGIRRLIAYVVDAGVTGVVALGSTGESATLCERQRRTVVASVAESLEGRVPLIVGVAQVDLESARAELRAASAAGACAALVTPPYYAPPDQAAIAEFYRRLAADAVLPLLIYNIPLYTKVSVEPTTVRMLADEGTVVGMKDSSGNFGYHTRVLAAMRELPRFRLFMGNETMLLAALCMGSCGSICATANVAPGLLLRLVRHFQDGDLAAARAEQFEVAELVSALMVGGLPLGYKAALALMGLCEPWPAAPTRPLDPSHLPTLRAVLEQHGLLHAPTLAGA